MFYCIQIEIQGYVGSKYIALHTKVHDILLVGKQLQTVSQRKILTVVVYLKVVPIVTEVNTPTTDATPGLPTKSNNYIRLLQTINLNNIYFIYPNIRQEFFLIHHM